MKRILLLLVVITTTCLNAQTTFWTEDFGTGCNQLQLANGLNPGGNGTWTVTSQGAEDPQANNWFISATENGNPVGTCGTGCGSNQTLHVSRTTPVSSTITPCPGDCGAFYDAGGTTTSTGTNKRAESPVINCTGHSTITLSFKYMEGGQGSTDDASLWYFDGSSWTQINALAKTAAMCSAPTFGIPPGFWTAFSVTLPASADNNPNVKLGFLWLNNNDGVGTDPSFAVDSITLTDVISSTNPVVSITPSPSSTVCVNSTLTLNGSATNGPITSYSWTVNPAGATFTPNATTPTVAVTFSASGTYTFTLAATNASGTGVGTQVITVTPAASSSVSIVANPSNPACLGSVFSFTAFPANAGTNPDYQWQVNGINAGTNSQTFTPAALLTNDVVSVTVTPTVACMLPSVNSYTIQEAAVITPSVSISVSLSATVCTGGSVTFNATPSGGGTAPSFQWIKNGISSGTNSPIYTFVPSNNDQVYVTMTSNSPCASVATANSNTITITVLAGSVITAGPLKTICSGDTTKLSSTGTNWAWSPSTGLSCTNCQNPKASPGTTTVYTVTGSNGSCTSSASQTVVVNQSATALFATSGTVIGIPQTINFINNSLNSTGYIWDFGDNSGTVVVTNPSHTYNTIGDYTVTLIAFSANGCNDTASAQLLVSDTAGLRMPNIFTPNGDGINDVFAPNAHGLKTLTCTIYDRWGAKITDLDMNTQQYWDGHTTSGSACSDGTYFYTLKATDVNGKSYSLKGFIQLIR